VNAVSPPLKYVAVFGLSNAGMLRDRKAVASSRESSNRVQFAPLFEGHGTLPFGHPAAVADAVAVVDNVVVAVLQPTTTGSRSALSITALIIWYSSDV
jgi:hypothetical protein